MTIIEKRAKEYSDQAVKDRGEYPNYSEHTQKQLTKFDGYDLETAYEEGESIIIGEIKQALDFVSEYPTERELLDFYTCVRGFLLIYDHDDGK